MLSVCLSSNAFPVRTLDAIFEECQKQNIEYLELGSGVAYDAEARAKIIAEKKKRKIILHNYIPAPREPFVLNLASADEATRKQSTALAETALEISAAIEAPIYAVHSGFAYHAAPELLTLEVRASFPTCRDARSRFRGWCGATNTSRAARLRE